MLLRKRRLMKPFGNFLLISPHHTVESPTNE
jgi:hypothetical protein